MRTQLSIGGEWCDGATGEVITTEDPATGEPLAEVSRALPADVDRAVAIARTCVDNRVLVDLRPADRGRLLIDVARALRERAEEFARLITLDSGKSIGQAADEVEGSARYFEFYGGQAEHLRGEYIPLGRDFVDYVVPVPYGVSAQIIPWNYPLEMTARSLAPAFAAGNASVVKAPELDPLPVILLGELLADAGLPPGSFNIVTGYGHDAGAHLTAHPGVDQIVFTGSVVTGQSIMRAAAGNVVPTVMELGGKSAGVVFADADLDAVTESVRWGSFLNSGQACNLMSRLVVERAVYDEVVERVVELVESFTVGPGIDGHFATPLIAASQLDRVAAYARTGGDEGGKLVAGGEPVDRPGHFMAPPVFAGVTPEMTIAREEIFGPVLSVMPFDGEAEAIDVANGTDYGLAAGVFTADLDRALLLADRLEAGQVYVNEWYAGGVETPFGGFKHSGFGREKGAEALANYHQSKNVGIRRLRTEPGSAPNGGDR